MLRAAFLFGIRELSLGYIHTINMSAKVIKHWAKDDRPREKFREKGKLSLSDAELIAILIGSGIFETNAVDLARQILKAVNNNLNELACLLFEDFIKFKGIGEAKALTIMAALELGRRRKDFENPPQTFISGSKDVFTYFKPFLLDIKHEEFWILLLKRNGTILKPVKISSGGLSGTATDTRLIFKSALDHLASSMILVHNHPSGNRNPSNQDKAVTKSLVNAGKLMEIPVIDHVIFTDFGYFSFADEGAI